MPIQSYGGKPSGGGGRPLVWERLKLRYQALKPEHGNFPTINVNLSKKIGNILKRF